MTNKRYLASYSLKSKEGTYRTHTIHLTYTQFRNTDTVKIHQSPSPIGGGGRNATHDLQHMIQLSNYRAT